MIRATRFSVAACASVSVVPTSGSKTTVKTPTNRRTTRLEAPPMEVPLHRWLPTLSHCSRGKLSAILPIQLSAWPWFRFMAIADGFAHEKGYFPFGRRGLTGELGTATDEKKRCTPSAAPPLQH